MGSLATSAASFSSHAWGYKTFFMLNSDEHEKRFYYLGPGPKSELLFYQCIRQVAWCQQLKTTYSNIFYKTTESAVLKFHMEPDLTPGFQNCKIGSGWMSKMATIAKIAKYNKINFSRIRIYLAELWHGTSAEHRYLKWQKCKNSVTEFWPTFYLQE